MDSDDIIGQIEKTCSMEVVNSANSATTGRNYFCQLAIDEPLTTEVSASDMVRSRRLIIQAFV